MQVQKAPEKREKTSEIPNWALYFGIGATVLAAGAATVYIVKTKRDEELKKMRAGGAGVQVATLEDFSQPRSTISRYWSWTVEAFGKVNRFVGHLIKSTEQPRVGNPLVDEDELAVYGMSSDGEPVA